MARHSAPHPSTARRAVLVLAAAGVALGTGSNAAAAEAESLPGVLHTRPVGLGETDPGAGLQALTGTVRYVTGPIEGLKPNPLAGTGVDPLDNGVGTQIADFRPLSSQALTRPVAQAPSVSSIPLLGQVPGVLHG